MLKLLEDDPLGYYMCPKSCLWEQDHDLLKDREDLDSSLDETE